MGVTLPQQKKKRATELGQRQDNLFIQGIILGKVAWVESIVSEGKGPPSKMRQSIQDHGFASDSEGFDDYLRILTANVPLFDNVDRTEHSIPYESKEILSDFELSLVRFYLDANTPVQDAETGKKKIKVALAIGDQMFDRAFYVTEDNKMGACELHTQVGDEVCILYGENMPFILRHACTDEAVTPNRRGYAMVGSCYLHGFMHGEALQAAYFNVEKEENFWFPGSKPYSSVD